MCVSLIFSYFSLSFVFIANAKLKQLCRKDYNIKNSKLTITPSVTFIFGVFGFLTQYLLRHQNIFFIQPSCLSSCAIKSFVIYKEKFCDEKILAKEKIMDFFL